MSGPSWMHDRRDDLCLEAGTMLARIYHRNGGWHWWISSDAPRADGMIWHETSPQAFDKRLRAMESAEQRLHDLGALTAHEWAQLARGER